MVYTEQYDIVCGCGICENWLNENVLDNEISLPAPGYITFTIERIVMIREVQGEFLLLLKQTFDL